MSKVIEINKCSECPHMSFGRNGRTFCHHPTLKGSNRSELTKVQVNDQLPEWCPLEDKDDYCESNFDIDRKF
jgi:hypothetical protein